jgi:hypothetical protein
MSRVPALVARLLTMTCTITPRVDGSADGDNVPAPGYPTPQTGVKCRVVDLDDSEIAGSRLGTTVVYSDAILLPLGTNVARHARVSDIREHDGALYAAGPFEVVDLKIRRALAPVFVRALVKGA